jgi:drug/metabolite transporter (DMT)-like permease
MLWLTAIILSYFCFALSSLGDKIVLAGPSKPKSYTFFVGLLSLFVVFLIPFVEFELPTQTITWWFIILEAFVYVAALYAMFYALENYDVSKIMPTIGAAQPVLIALLSALFWGYQDISGIEVLAFIILLTGSVLISIDKNPKITRKSLEISLIAALLFSLDFVFSKFVYNDLDFWNGFIWMRLLSFLFVLVFFFDKEFRKEIKGTDAGFDRKTGVLFISTQTFGGLANILQSLAISLVPISYLAIMNAMKGVQYVFLFVLVILISLFLPKVLKEETSKAMIIQKIVAIFVIGLGLAILVI